MMLINDKTYYRNSNPFPAPIRALTVAVPKRLAKRSVRPSLVVKSTIFSAFMISRATYSALPRASVSHRSMLF